MVVVAGSGWIRKSRKSSKGKEGRNRRPVEDDDGDCDEVKLGAGHSSDSFLLPPSTIHPGHPKTFPCSLSHPVHTHFSAILRTWEWLSGQVSDRILWRNKWSEAGFRRIPSISLESALSYTWTWQSVATKSFLLTKSTIPEFLAHLSTALLSTSPPFIHTYTCSSIIIIITILLIASYFFLSL